MLTGDGCLKCKLIEIMQQILNSKEIQKKKYQHVIIRRPTISLIKM